MGKTKRMEEKFLWPWEICHSKECSKPCNFLGALPRPVSRPDFTLRMLRTAELARLPIKPASLGHMLEEGQPACPPRPGALIPCALDPHTRQRPLFWTCWGSVHMLGQPPGAVAAPAPHPQARPCRLGENFSLVVSTDL